MAYTCCIRCDKIVKTAEFVVNPYLKIVILRLLFYINFAHTRERYSCYKDEKVLKRDRKDGVKR